MKQKLRRQELEEDYIEIEVEDNNSMNDMLASMGVETRTGKRPCNSGIKSVGLAT